MVSSRRRNPSPGMRAIEASGDGFWEINLSNGATWFSNWFYERLEWPAHDVQQTWSALRPMMQPDTWELLLRAMRVHLENDVPFDVEIAVQIGGSDFQWWRFHGAAERSDSRQPVYLAGSVRDVSTERAERLARSEELSLWRNAFEALPLPAALLDEAGVITNTNRLWREFPASGALLGEHFADGSNYLAQCAAGGTLPAHKQLANGLQALLQGAGEEFAAAYATAAGNRRRVRAVPIDCAGARKLIVTDTDIARENLIEDAS